MPSQGTSLIMIDLERPDHNILVKHLPQEVQGQSLLAENKKKIAPFSGDML